MAYEFTLDTPVWNVRTNVFYSKLGYKEIKHDEESVFYIKYRGESFAYYAAKGCDVKKLGDYTDEENTI